MPAIRTPVTPEAFAAFRRKTGSGSLVLGSPVMTIGLMAFAAAIVAFTIADSISVELPPGAGFLFGAVAGIAMVPYESVRSGLMSRLYGEFYRNYEFYTPAGERCEFRRASPGGNRVTVRFGDGTEQTYHVKLLCTADGRFHDNDGRPPKHITRRIRFFSSLRWRMPDGSEGIVRSWSCGVLTLRLDDGRVVSRRSSDLDPTTVPAKRIGPAAHTYEEDHH